MISARLKEIRLKTGKNKKEFASYIGIKYTTYNNYETGAREPSSDFLILISKKFDVSIDYILGLHEEKELLHSYELKSTEYEHIKKYRDLDSHGMEMVDFTLTKEWERSIFEKRDSKIYEFGSYNGALIAEEKANYNVDAAHIRTDIEVTEEMMQHDDDIMDDENF